MSYNNNNFNIFDVKSSPTEFSLIANLDIKSITPFYNDIDFNNYATMEVYNNSSDKILFLVKDIKAYNAEGASSTLRFSKNFIGVSKIINTFIVANNTSLGNSLIVQQPFLCTQLKWLSNPLAAATTLVVAGYRIELN